MDKVGKIEINMIQELKYDTVMGKCEICGEVKEICPVRLLKTTLVEGKKIEYPPYEKKLCKDCLGLLSK